MNSALTREKSLILPPSSLFFEKKGEKIPGKHAAATQRSPVWGLVWANDAAYDKPGRDAAPSFGAVHPGPVER